MAASICKKRHKNTGLCVSLVFIVLNFLPFCDTFSLQNEDITLNIPHTADVGFLVMKAKLVETCLSVDHILRKSDPINPFTIKSDGCLVTKSSLVNNVGDLFSIRHKSFESCSNSSVSRPFLHPVLVEITDDHDRLKFVNDYYEGIVPVEAPVNTKVLGIEHLFATSSAGTHQNNLDYRIVGTDNFYLVTVSKDDGIEVEIFTKKIVKHDESFIIVAKNAKGQQGHTNVDVQRGNVADNSLYFVSNTNRRHKRDTQEILPPQQVDETATGVIFTLSALQLGQQYRLVSSTYKDAFTVSSNGAVSVASGFNLDYETLTANGGSSSVQLVINVENATDNSVVKELLQVIGIVDVNDEPPQFTNVPKPFLAAVNPNAPAGILVYSLTAMDPDDGSNIRLEVDSQTSNRVNQFFTVNIQGNKADILRSGSNPFTENEIFNIHFIATDLSAPAGTSQRTTAFVEIKAGAREVQFMKQNIMLYFQEENTRGQIIDTIEVFSFQDRPVIFQVFDMNGEPSPIFMAEALPSTNQIKGCRITVNRVIDYEKGPREYNVTLKATEEETGLVSEKLVQIFVTDKNEFQPTFTKSAYTHDNVPEDIAVGSSILTVTAKDEDYGSEIMFSVNNSLFRVETIRRIDDDTVTASLVVNKHLDYDLINPKNYEFNVFAKDNGAIPKTGRATIQIFMLDVNDEKPKFPDTMTTQLRYDAPVGQEVYYVFASDADSGDKVTYRFAQPYQKFEIDSDTGSIKLKSIIATDQALIQEFTYELRVIATDDGGCCGKTNSLSSTGTVTINILTDNQYRPSFDDCLSYDPSVDEEVADAFVIQVQATDRDHGRFGEVTYSVEGDSKFRINSTTGDLYTKVPIDRETDLDGASKLVVNVVATDGGNSENVCSLLVLINDINDNDPIFTSNNYDFTAPNSLGINKVVAFIEAKDKDIQVNAQVSYSFASDSQFFDLAEYTGEIKVKAALPSEPQVVNLIAVATDRGVPPRHSNASVSIRIVREDTTQPPTWIGSNPPDFTINVSEIENIGTQLMTFTARSDDSNSNALTFTTKYPVGDEAIFIAKNKNTNDTSVTMGELLLAKYLDYEKTQRYSVTLRASDIYNTYNDRIIIVNVDDENDNIPDFPAKSSESGWLELSFDEGNYTGDGSGKLIDTIRAIDNDRSSRNNQIEKYQIAGSNSLFSIDERTGELYAKGIFDRESENYVFNLIVEAVDNAPSALLNNGQHNTGQVTVKITINDVNDNKPVFDQDNYQFSAPEDLQSGSNIPDARVRATDPDSTAVLTYNVRSIGGPVPFSVQRQTGDIIVESSLDYEKGPDFQKYIFEVVVDDSKNSATTTVTVSVTDVNDNRPVVTGTYEFNDFTEEDPDDIGVIAKVTATDLDNDGVNTFYYRLSFPSPEDQQYFDIDLNTGELSIIKKLDRDYPDGKAEFQFMVVVADDLVNPLLGYGDVSVRPKDINDNDPFFPVEDSEFRVLENQPVDTRVGRVKAEDYDYMENGTVDVSVLEIRPESVFRLDDTTLDIFTTQSLDREVIDKYYIVVEATDQGLVERRSGTGTLTVYVGDENDNAPFFNQSYRFPLSEHQLSDEIGRVQAIDYDTGPNAVITYTIATKDASHFQMDQDRALNQGVLKIYVPVDYDEPSGSQRNFNITVYAVDPEPGPNNNRRAETYIIVEVSDYNDEVPKFEVSEILVSVPENTPIGYSLATFNATDRDINPDFGSFEYYIQRITDLNRRFAIDQGGVVTIQNLLDREAVSVHRVHILAIDNVNGSPQNTGTATLIVTVGDVNDNFPDFAADYQPTLTENTDFNDYSVITLSAVDADNATNGQPFSFELACNHEGASAQCSKFRLDFNPSGDGGRGTGTVYVTGRFDSEVERVVVLPIKMCDLFGVSGRNDQQCGHRFLNVEIHNENDNDHNDGYQYITVFNYKGMFNNIEIGIVNPNDPDDPSDPDPKTYTLENTAVSGYFVSVQPDTGKITLLSNVPEMSFEISVRVEDNKGLVKISKIRITIIFVTDDALFNAGAIRIDGVTDKDFLTKPKKEGGPSSFGPSMMEKFRSRMAEKLYGSSAPDKVANVEVLSIMGYDTYTDVMIAAHGSPYYQRSRIEGIVASDRQGFNSLLQTDGVKNTGEIAMVPVDMCQFESCEGGCYNELIVADTPKLVNTYGASYVGVDTRINGTCGCRAKTFPPEIECTPGYCYHGGECKKDLWGVVSCICPDGFTGPRCQKLRQSFDGTGYALYRPLEQCEESRTSIEILTSNPNGLILYNGPVSAVTPSDPTDFISLELIDGQPLLRINHGTGEISMRINGASRLNDGAWHRIDIFRDRKNVRMVVDHCVNSRTNDRSDCEVAGVTKGENIYINTADPLQLGGRINSPTYPAGITEVKFNGCMKNLIHNAEIYDLSTGGQFPGATDGCKREDDACDVDCKHGHCMITGAGPNTVDAECVCLPGYRKSSSATCDTRTSVRDFGTESFMDWRIKNTFKALLDVLEMEITFHFRTRDQNGLIFSLTDENDSNKYIKFKVVNSQLQVIYNLGDDRYELPLIHVPKVNDGQWHKVTLERYGKEFILKMDSGEGRYYADTLGPINGPERFLVRQDQVYAGASVSYSSGSASFNGDDFNSSCMNDIRFDNGWFPMTDDEESESPAATLESSVNTKAECIRNDCPDFRCPDPFVCQSLWEAFECVCPQYYVQQGDTCVERDYCTELSPCFGGATCLPNIPPGPGENPYKCVCPAGWYGPSCQCNPSLNPGGSDCETSTDPEESVSMAGGIIAAIVLGIIFLIVVILIIIYLLMRRSRSETKEPFDDDMDDDIRENVMYYDEEGAGEEDQTQYDLSRLRKPDDGEHPSTWDAPDVPVSTKPLGSAPDRPDVGDFIGSRLNDANDDPNSPPYDTPHDFNYEGGSSDAGSLSSLNTSSTGSQDYDYLNEWGPKFAKLADMYNNYDDTE